jgi:hypothetical protein
VKVRIWLNRLWSSYERRHAIRVQVRNALTDERGAEDLQRMRKGIRRMPPAGF